MTRRVVVVGATGLIGRPLCGELIRAGHAVVVFSRDPSRAQRLVPGAAGYVAWGPGRLPAEGRGHLGSADAVVYLAGGPLFDGRRHSRKDVVTESQARSGALGQLVTALGGLSRRPSTLIAASSVGYYGYAGHSDALVDETHPAGADWWGQDSAGIEQAALAANAHGVRTVVLRTGYVLTADSLASQVAQFRHRAGGWIGTGRGWTPWIHIADEVGLITFALAQPQIRGPVNLTAPEPVRAREFAQALGRALGRRAWLLVPTPMVRMGLGVITDILVRGKRVIPAQASALGYQFRFPGLDAALHDLLGHPDTTVAAARQRGPRPLPGTVQLDRACPKPETSRDEPFALGTSKGCFPSGGTR
jgi:uncharacterized protein (TIGR01777 family)